MKSFLAISIVSFFFFLNNLHSQAKEIILYKDFHFLNSSPFIRPTNFETKPIQSYGFAIAYKKMKSETKYNQFEVNVILDRSNETNNTSNRQEVLLNYRKGKYFKKNLFKVLRVKYVPSFNIKLFNENEEPGANNEFPVERFAAGIGLSVLGGLEYTLSDKFNIHLAINMFGVSFSLDTSHVDNPALTERQRQQSGFSGDFFGERILKIGVGYTL